MTAHVRNVKDKIWPNYYPPSSRKHNCRAHKFRLTNENLNLFTNENKLFSSEAKIANNFQCVSSTSVEKLGIYRDKTMADKMMYIPNDDTQNNPFCILKLFVETVVHST